MTRTLGETLRLSTVVSVWPVELDSSSVVSISPKIDNGNRLLNWPKLLGLYAVGFSSIFVPE